MTRRDEEDIKLDIRNTLKNTITPIWQRVDDRKLVDLIDELIDYKLQDLDDKINKSGRYAGW